MTEPTESVEATLALAQQKTSLRAQFITKKSTNTRFGLSPAEAGFFVRYHSGLALKARPLSCRNTCLMPQRLSDPVAAQANIVAAPKSLHPLKLHALVSHIKMPTVHERPFMNLRIETSVSACLECGFLVGLNDNEAGAVEFSLNRLATPTPQEGLERNIHSDIRFQIS